MRGAQQSADGLLPAGTNRAPANITRYVSVSGQVKGLKESDMEILIAMRGHGYRHIDQLRAAGVPEVALERLADADAFRSTWNGSPDGAIGSFGFS